MLSQIIDVIPAWKASTILHLILLQLMVTIIFLIHRRLTGAVVNTREPPVLSISSIWHIIGMIRYQGDYLKSLSLKYVDWPVFTMKIFSTNIYVVNTPQYIQAILGNMKSVSFYPFHIAFTNRALGARQEIKDIVAHNGANNRYMKTIHHEMYNAFQLGPHLNETKRRVVKTLAQYFNDIDASPQTRSLFSWTKLAYTMALADSFYGPDNPIRQRPEFVKHIWEFEEGLPMLFLDFFPSITARKAWNARRILTSAFEDYYNKGLDKNSNAFIAGRARAARVEKFTNNDLAGFEITICFAALTNTVPNSFFMLCNILADPILTADIREEVSQIVTRTIIDGHVKLTMDISSLEKDCPLLVSCYNETLRMCVNATPVRVVMEDMILKDTYNLKKGGIIQIPGGALHESERTWGNDVGVFNGRRFLNKKHMSREQRKAQIQGLFPFGGGKHLCPGRHLAFSEIASFVAMMICGFDVKMRDGGLIKPPPFKGQQLGENSKKPNHDIDVIIERRKEFEGVVWAFKVETALVTPSI